MKRYRDWSPRQSFLLPPSPMDWLPEGHLAYFILEVVTELDLESSARSSARILAENARFATAAFTRHGPAALVVRPLLHCHRVRR